MIFFIYFYLFIYFIDAEIDKELTKDRVKEFRNILLHYIDFQQKQKVGLCLSVPL